MSLQKLRTPKGLATLQALAAGADKNRTLILLQRLQNIYCAVWTESMWPLAAATSSTTKFIISDHPVTVYNRKCPPLSIYCRGHSEPARKIELSVFDSGLTSCAGVSYSSIGETGADGAPTFRKSVPGAALELAR
jgi:hypothetical protein